MGKLLRVSWCASTPVASLRTSRASTQAGAHRVSVSVEGVYLGHAPSTPGGHLVLISLEEGPKVILTNTVYPVRSHNGAIRKPKYRLVGKRSPTFAVRVVAAAEFASLSCFSGARLSPGGESSSDSGSESVLGPSFNLEESGFRWVPHGGPDLEAEDSSLGEVESGTGVFGETDLSFEDVLDSGSPENAAGSKLGVGSWVNRLRTNDEAVSSWIREKSENGDFTGNECCEVLEKGLGQLPSARRPMIKGKGRAVLLGFYGIGGFRGFRRLLRCTPRLRGMSTSFFRSNAQDTSGQRFMCRKTPRCRYIET